MIVVITVNYQGPKTPTPPPLNSRAANTDLTDNTEVPNKMPGKKPKQTVESNQWHGPLLLAAFWLLHQ